MGSDVVSSYHEALRERNFAAARDLLRDDLRFKGPFEEFDDADSYSKTVQGLFGVVESIEVKHQSSAGDEVVVLYDMVTKSPAGTQLICEWYRVEGGKIASIRALFDTAPFAFLREGR
jgi:SnoaL-like domain